MTASINEIVNVPEDAKLIVCAEPITVRPAEAAKMLGISRMKVYELAARADFDGAFKLDGCTLISVEALKNWVKAQTRTQHSEKEGPRQCRKH